ncbi:transcriptional regulator, LacI family [Actinacidiphila guanduensis]|uniref:Transcriptional regulator, LacI family n=1 Tax=Actinacidiphila guanduensis TaxID=310781 RepID=A0A1G9ZK08_9ACTN|nr:transcriptional regulator, LacI family [Actinacidiphila guanduensis]
MGRGGGVAARLKDVAERAGVSVRTVSNVVSNAPAVAPDTRARVRRAIDELGYRPNLAARNLRQGRTGLIGLAIPEIHSPYFGELAGLLVEAARERGWTLLIEQTAGSAERELEFLSGRASNTLDGMAISPWAIGTEQLRRHTGGTPLVVLGESDPQGAADHVVIDNVAAAREMTSHLLESGRTRVAAVGSQPHLGNGTAALRLRGMHEALAAAGRTIDPALEVPVASLHREEGRRAMGRLLDHGSPPDAVFCFSDELALGAVYEAKRRGLDVPGDVAVAGFDDIEDGRYATPGLTTISPRKDQIAASTLQCLADRVYGRLDHLPARRITVPHRLVVRESTGR